MTAQAVAQQGGDVGVAAALAALMSTEVVEAARVVVGKLEKKRLSYRLILTALNQVLIGLAFFSKYTTKSCLRRGMYDEQMEHIAKQEDVIKELREEVKDLMVLCKEQEQQISNLQRDHEGGGELGLNGHDEQMYLLKQNEENYKKRIRELEKEVSLLLEKAQDELDAQPDAAIRIRRQESVEAIEQLAALRVETDELRSQLNQRRVDDLNSMLNHHAISPEGFCKS